VIVEHNAAVRLLIASIGFYDGQVPNQPTFPYRVLYMDTGNERAERLCATSQRVDFRFQITSVALSAVGVGAVADASRAVLLDVRPVVAGWSPGLIRKEQTLLVREDRDVTDTATGLHPMYSADTYVFTSRKD
jgi:hypothetical protein